MEHLDGRMTTAATTSEATRTAWFLGLRADSDLDLVRRVERGFPTKSADTLARRLDPQGQYLRVTDIIPKSTYHRRIKAKEPFSKEESEKLFSLAKVFAEVARQYDNDMTRVGQFMARKHPLLDGQTPLDVAKRTSAGADLVLKILAQADAGVAA
jgi:putative toxin-antitoxin system antitoxin component (TIGR02293 family)